MANDMEKRGGRMDYRQLTKMAFEAQKKAYAPYSRFSVGAALLCADGRVFSGCNIENSSLGVSNCAERTALFTAVYEGYRDFTAIAVVGKSEEDEEFDLCAPCGICRQALSEFCDADTFDIILARTPDDYEVYKLKDLFPLHFILKN